MRRVARRIRGAIGEAAFTWMAACCGAALLAATRAAGGAADPAALLRAADAACHPIEEGVLTLRATVIGTAPEPASISDVEVYVRGAADSLSIFRGGPLAGRRILTAGDRTWLLVPGSKRAIPVSASQRLMGGASIGDVAALRYADQFNAVERPGEETVEGVSCRVLDLAAKSRRAGFGGGVLWVGVRDGLPRRARLTLRSGKPAKEVRYDFRAAPGGAAALERITIDHLLPSEGVVRTTLDMVAAAHRPLDAALFSPAGAGALP